MFSWCYCHTFLFIIVINWFGRDTPNRLCEIMSDQSACIVLLVFAVKKAVVVTVTVTCVLGALPVEPLVKQSLAGLHAWFAGELAHRADAEVDWRVELNNINDETDFSVTISELQYMYTKERPDQLI